MIIHLYILCYNEEGIIYQVLKYYNSFCSKIFLLDNYSTDCSAEIASDFSKVTIIPWHSNQQLDDYKHVQLKEQYYKAYSRAGSKKCEEPADWVITCDMDELIYHPNLLNVLENYKKNHVTVANIKGFNMVSAKELAEISDLVTEVRTGTRAKVFDKPILFGSAFDMVFSPGCHPFGQGFEKMKQQPGYKMGCEAIALLHYKFIGQRFIEKAKINNARLSDANRLNGLGHHYQKTISELEQKNLEMRIKAREVIDDVGRVIF